MNKQEMQEWFDRRRAEAKNSAANLNAGQIAVRLTTPAQVAETLQKSLEYLWDGTGNPATARVENKEAAICFALCVARDVNGGRHALYAASASDFVMHWLHVNGPYSMLVDYFVDQGLQVSVHGVRNRPLVQKLRRQWVLDRVKELQELQ